MVYVDKVFDTTPYQNCWHVPRCMRNGACHMWADNLNELLVVAKRIGLKADWLQNEGGKFQHFDLTPRKRIAALSAGAVEKDLKEYLREFKIEYNSR